MIRFLYIGSVVPDEAPYINRAFSRAGNMCQLALLKGLNKTALNPSAILSLRPAVSFPKSRSVYFGKANLVMEGSLKLDFLPFVNITPIKQLYAGLTALWAILRWGCSTGSPAQRIVYTFNISVPSGFFTLLGAWLTKSKCVAMIYDICVPGETAPDRLFYRLDYWLHRKALPLFDGLVVITDAIAKDFAPGVPYLRIEGGIKADFVEQFAAVEADASRDGGIFRIVAVGMLDEANGFREILEAFSLLQGGCFRLEIAGTGPLESLVRDSAHKDSRIVYHGFLPFEEVLKLYAKADVLVNMRLTQRINTRYFFPSKMMEYLASGVPVISTCPGNMADEYGRFAYLLEDETSESLAELLTRVSEIPVTERLARSQAARGYMIAHKTWDAQAHSIADWLERLFSNSAEGAR